MTTTEAAWRREYARAHAAVPAAWVWTDPADGRQGVDPAHAGHPLVKHLAGLMRVGHARGWL